MEKLVTTLLETSITMSIIIVSFLILTSLLSKKYSAKWWYYTWLIIIAGLLIPFRPKFEAALINIENPVSPPTNVQQVITDYTAGAETPGTFVELSQQTGQTLALSWYQIAGYVWITGMVAVFLFHTLRHYRFMKLVKRWSKNMDDPIILGILQQVQIDMDLSKHIKLKCCPFVTSPMIVGFVKPVILLPANPFSSEELKFIFKHELVHFKRKDLWYKALVLTATIVHWFNPIVHLMARIISIHCEASCDEAVIENADLEDRRRYGETIIGVVRNQSKIKTAFSTNFYGGKKGMKSRLFSILDQSKKRKSILIVCCVLTATVVSSAVFAYGKDEQTNQKYGKFLGDHWQDMTVEEYEVRLSQIQAEQFRKAPSFDQTATSSSSEGGIQAAHFASVTAFEQGDGSNQTDESLKQYLNYGVTYEQKTDRYIFDKKVIRLLIDENMKVKKETHTLYFDANGQIDVKVIRGTDDKIKKITEVNKKALEDLSDKYGFSISNGNINFH